MLYELLVKYVDIFSFLNVFKYLTFRTGLAFFTSLLIALLIGGPFIRLFSNKKIFNQIIDSLKSLEQLSVQDLNLDDQIIEKINKFAPIKHILKNQNNDDQKIIELLEDISRDLMNFSFLS